jgi:RNA polymerase sigma factor (sigma-70 family)
MRSAQLSAIVAQLERMTPGQAAEIPDGELLQRFGRLREEAAFAALVDRHGLLVWSVCQRMLPNRHDVEDAFQATFLVLARKAGSVRWQPTVANWLYEVAYRVSSHIRAGNARHKAAAMQAADEVRRTSPIPAAEMRELSLILDEELRRLPAKYRAPLLLCYLEERTRDDAARHLNCSLGTLKYRLERGRALLRARLIRRGVVLPAALLAAGLANTAEAPAALLRSAIAGAAAYSFASSQKTHISAAALQLAETTIKGLGAAKLKLTGAAVIAICLLATIGVTVGSLGGDGKNTPPAAKPVTGDQQRGPVPESGRDRFDRYGDPLPPGAIARLGTVRLRTGLGVSAIAFSADGKRLASCGWDDTVRVWDLASGKELRSTGCGSGAIAFSPRGGLFAAGETRSGALILEDVSTGREVGRLNTDKSSIRTVAFSADGKMLATGSHDRTIRLWDVGARTKVGELLGHEAFVASVAFSPDGKRLASGSDDRTVCIWDVSSGKEIRRLDRHDNRVNSVAFSPDGTKLASGSEDHTFCVWDAATGKALWSSAKQKAPVESVAFSPDGKLLAASGDSFIRLWDAASGKPVRHWKAYTNWVNAVAFSPDGKILASGSAYDAAIHLWDVQTGRELRPIVGHCGSVGLVSFSPDGQTLTTWGTDQRFCRWDLRSGSPECRTLRLSEAPLAAISFSADRRTLATVDKFDDFTIRIWDAESDRQIRAFGTVPGPVPCITLSPDARALATWSVNDPTIHLWDVATGTDKRSLKGHSKRCYCLRFSPDGKLLASSSVDRTLRIWDCATGAELRHWEQPRFPSYRVVFSPDGKLIAAAGVVQKAHVWDVSTGRELPELRGSQDSASSLAFSADGRFLAAGRGERDPDAIHVWETATGQEVQTFHGHQCVTSSLTFSPDGRTLASGEADSTALLWDLTGGLNREGATSRSAHEMEVLWNDLASQDARRPYEARWALAQTPAQAVPFLANRVRPIRAPEPHRVAKLLSELDDPQFAVRERATAELAKLAESVMAEIHTFLRSDHSPEARGRAQKLLEDLESQRTPERLRLLRAVGILETIGSAEATAVLSKIAEGVPEARLTREAKASLERLARRASGKP